MSNKSNATCSICNRPYYKCLSCKDSMKLHPWQMYCDTAEHYKVFQVIHGISTNVYTKDEAKAKLKNIDLSDLDIFRPHIKDIIKDILKEDKKVVKPVIDADKSAISRKRNFKVETDAE